MKSTSLLSILLLLSAALACQNNKQALRSPGMSAIIKQDSLDRRNKEIALGCIHASERDDIEYIISHSVKDAVDYYINRPPMRGIDSLRIALRQMQEMFREFRLSNELAVADNNYVFVYYNGDESLKADSTGKIYHTAGIHLFKFNEEGKVLEHAHVGEELKTEEFFNRQQ
ncbi:MAG TPA: nuclear transport factor 2 family protein [Parafilimonas sp.]|nr:nuclear transport factor 2 family protein [Parafilimonas sp.]